MNLISFRDPSKNKQHRKQTFLKQHHGDGPVLRLNIHTKRTTMKMCLKYFDLQEKQHTIVDETWNEIEQMTGELKKTPAYAAMELDAFPVKFLHDFIAYICKYPWQQWNWSWREDLISFVWERKLGIWDVLFSHMQSTFGPNHSILNLHQVWKMSLYSK